MLVDIMQQFNYSVKYKHYYVKSSRYSPINIGHDHICRLYEFWVYLSTVNWHLCVGREIFIEDHIHKVQIEDY